MNSILDLVVNFIQKVQETAFGEEILCLDDMTSRLLAISKDFSIEMTELSLSLMNEEIRKDKAGRKEMGLTLQEKDRNRTYTTELGDIHYQRDYFRQTEDGRFIYLLDRLIEVDPYDRIGKNLSACLVEKATEVSYAEASRTLTRGRVSRQTVRNKIQKLGALEYREECPKKREVRELHIHADEDHDHLQKENKQKGKRLQINPLVVVTEGTRPVGTGRNETIHARRFVDAEFDTGRLADSVEGYLYETYDMDKVEKVYLHADGGNWMKGLLADVKQKVDVLDGYHLESRMRKLSSKYPGKSVRYRLMRAIQNDDRKDADRIFQDLQGKAETDAVRETVRDTAKYILGHWEAVVRRMTDDIPGSCTEAQVSHILSARFSRAPMGWSKETLGKLSSQRVYVLNGGTITGENFSKDEKKQPYAEYMNRYIERIQDRKLDWSIVERQAERIFDTASGTQQAIRNLGRMRDIMLS